MKFIDNSPTSFHATANIVNMLMDNGVLVSSLVDRDDPVYISWAKDDCDFQITFASSSSKRKSTEKNENKRNNNTCGRNIAYAFKYNF